MELRFVAADIDDDDGDGDSHLCDYIALPVAQRQQLVASGSLVHDTRCRA